ncbi:hypothetical protein D5R93_05285 [Actinomyces lilanjuaniae]|uniref:ABC-2 type transport system permease protein n=2 Tax=Actinomyces lilanjuaniae TaxID=2321394 RepID=A0ABN5PMQ5_9ACTO|nr:hypothetical protein D5R93_05285 [Actinomyces lilanjuaniae]
MMAGPTGSGPVARPTGGVPGGPAPHPPDLAQVRRWTRYRVSSSRRARTSWPALVSRIYSGLLYLAVLVTLLLPHLASPTSSVRRDPVGAGAGAGEAASPWLGLDPGWVAAALLLVLLGLAVTPLSRVGPMFLRPWEAVWWLRLPGRRDGLLLPVARAEMAGAAGLAAVCGLVLALLVGSGWLAGLAWAVLAATTGWALMTGLLLAQCRAAPVWPVRAVLTAAAAGALATGLFRPLPAGAAGVVGPGYLAAAAAGVAWSTWRMWVRPRLGDLRDADLLAVVARSLGAQVSLLSLDTRALGRILSPPVASPRRSSRLALAAWWSRRLPAGLRPVPCTVQADLLLLGRQPRRGLQLLAGLGGALLAQADSGTDPLVRVVAFLCAAWVATHAVAEPARWAWFDGVPDASWPTSPILVRAAHLLVPVAAMVPWSAAALVPVVVAGSVGWAMWLPVVVLAGAGWAGAALRSGLRPMPDWTAGLITSPIGSLPPGAVQAVVAGGDAVVLAGLPTALLAGGWQPSYLLVAAQAGASALVVWWGLVTGLRR